MSTPASNARLSPRPQGSDTVTRGIRVQVTPSYVPEQSGVSEAWKGQRHVFSYRIQIHNQGTETVQLLRRHWIIVDADGDRHEVHGEGVVGAQPEFSPDGAFEYSSYCPLATEWGTMEGEFTFIDEAGESFDVKVGRFFLVAPT